MKKPPITCNRRRQQCSQCKHQYTKEEHELWNCPECGFDRHCRNRVKREGQACKFHGRDSLRGAAHPNFQHGRYADTLTGTMLQDYIDLRSDPDLLALTDEIVLMRARAKQLLRSAMTGENERLWPLLKDAFQQLKEAIRAKDPTGMATELNTI